MSLIRRLCREPPNLDELASGNPAADTFPHFAKEVADAFFVGEGRKDMFPCTDNF